MRRPQAWIKGLRKYVTYPTGGVIESTGGMDTRDPHQFRLHCRFKDNETDAFFYSEKLRRALTHVTSTERALMPRILKCNLAETSFELGKLLAVRGRVFRIKRAWYGGAKLELRNMRFDYYYDRLFGVLAGICSTGTQVEFDVEKFLQSVPERHHNRVLYSFMLPLREVKNMILRMPDDQVIANFEEDGTRKCTDKASLTDELFPSDK
mmetsp:Transcript_8780/g.26378  ORF Transcript_8780/g.26378 Transcript_8780/m.26378 type:complete len:208 (+) Transcript_8780:90-713(+)